MSELAWNEQGLLPAVAQDATTGAILMLAWMNREALQATRDTGYATFFSRSRQALWKKGETSGNTLRVLEVRTDCDVDAILLLVDPAGPACHTGKPTCFFQPLARRPHAPTQPDAPAEPVQFAGGDTPLDNSPVDPDSGHLGAPAAIVDRLANVLRGRRDDATAEKSYTKSLFDKGFPKILDKIAEEAGELAEELPAGPRKQVVHETADLLFHVLVGLVARDIDVAEVWAELERRFGVSGHVEKASRTGK